MEFIIAVSLTLIFGPFAFWIFSQLSQAQHRFPISITGAIGDTVFLPLFNGAIAYHGLFSFTSLGTDKLWISGVITVLFSILYFFYRKNSDDWMTAQSGVFNFAGWYHLVFVLFQSFLIFTSLILFYPSILLWAILLGYLSTTKILPKLLK